MKPGKHQRNKQRCHDLCWKVHDPAQSFVLHSYTMHDYVTEHFYWLVPQYGVNNYCVLCTVKAKKEKKNIQQRNLTRLITIPTSLITFLVTLNALLEVCLIFRSRDLRNHYTIISFAAYTIFLFLTTQSRK